MLPHSSDGKFVMDDQQSQYTTLVYGFISCSLKAQCCVCLWNEGAMLQ